MDIDPQIANWVLEFLLRQPLEDRILNSLLLALPLSNDDAHLKKMILMRKIESNLSGSSISEGTLELFEKLEELEFRQGCETVSDAMKRAYCAVAVESTVQLLANIGDDRADSQRLVFFEAVKRVWRGRIGRMERMVEKGGLISEELSRWKDEMEAAVWEDSVFEGVVKKSKGVHAVEAVRAYMREEKEKMGPTFLELVAESVKEDGAMNGVLGVESGKEGHTACVGDVSNVGIDTQNKKIKHRDKLVGLKRSEGLMSGRSVGAKIVDSNETAAGPSHRNFNIPSSAGINKVREALDSSASKPHAVVKDPLPDPFQFAEREENKSCDSIEDDDDDETNLLILDGAGVVQHNGSNEGNGPKPSLMERNSSARTYKRDESHDSPVSNGRLTLPSPRILNVAPLDIYVAKNIKRRRKGRKWSVAEEDALRAGVQQFGQGNWKNILTAYREAFDDRTEVDLKDKWRNLTRRG